MGVYIYSRVYKSVVGGHRSSCQFRHHVMRPTLIFTRGKKNIIRRRRRQKSARHAAAPFMNHTYTREDSRHQLLGNKCNSFYTFFLFLYSFMLFFFVLLPPSQQQRHQFLSGVMSLTTRLGSISQAITIRDKFARCATGMTPIAI